MFKLAFMRDARMVDGGFSTGHPRGLHCFGVFGWRSVEEVLLEDLDFFNFLEDASPSTEVLWWHFLCFFSGSLLKTGRNLAAFSAASAA